MKPQVKVLFASGSDDLIPTAIERLKAIYPELPTEVVSEFPPPEGRWTPYHVDRSFWDNLALCRAHFRGKDIRLSAVILQPRMPYWRLRLLAFVLSPANFLAFNEDLGHFMLRPRSIPTIAKHLAWRTRNFFVWEFSPGGVTYTFLWRLVHPWAFWRPFLALLARAAGIFTAYLKFIQDPQPEPPLPAAKPEGITVVIPSRDGKDLLARALPPILRQSPEEIIVVDNGSTDGTAAFLRDTYPGVRVEVHAAPLSFAKAVNKGIEQAGRSHVCLVNNDMIVESGFFKALRGAFDEVPGLFCATAQIFFPAGVRREETGKAVIPTNVAPTDFPVRCDLSIEGEDHSYVLYGSGGCSLFDTAKLQSLRGFDELYEPAYVEDLDLGIRGWERGWPTVFTAGAKVLHQHRSTTRRYYTSEQLDRILEINHLRFIARSISGGRNFLGLWRDAIQRLNRLASATNPNRAARRALGQAWKAPLWLPTRNTNPKAIAHALDIATGDVTVFPGKAKTNRPVILVVSPYLPYPLSHGGAVRMFNLMKRAAQDFDQILIAFVDETAPVPEPLRGICIEVVTVKRVGTHLKASKDRPDVVQEFDRPAFHAAIRQTVRKHQPAIAQLEFTQMAQYAEDCAPAKTILVEHDITLDLYQQLLAQGEDWELRRQLHRWTQFETKAWKQIDRVVTMSARDQAMVANSSCLPNGVDLERFRPSPTPPDPGRILFIGSFAHLPNLLAIDFFLKESWPNLSSAVLHIIAGSRHHYFLDHYKDRVQPDLDQPGIELEGFVADVRPAYERAEIVIAPLKASAGTNIKIMEAMAMGKAIVSTPAGINGLDLHPGTDVIVVETGQQMAEAIQDLMQTPQKRESLEMNARTTVEQRYDWDQIAAGQKRLYEELIGSFRSG